MQKPNKSSFPQKIKTLRNEINDSRIEHYLASIVVSYMKVMLVFW